MLGSVILAFPVLSALAIAPGATGLRFDVVSVKPHLNSTDRTRVAARPGGHFTATAITLQSLVRFAYGVDDIQVAGARGWMVSDRFDVLADAEGISGAIPDDQLQAMLQALLTDRFQLGAHKDSKELSVYALVVGHNGVKLKPVSAGGVAAPPDHARKA